MAGRMTDTAGRPARSIALPIFALVIASVMAATAILFFVTFNGPPPRVPPRPLETIVAALKGQVQVIRHRSPPEGSGAQHYGAPPPRGFMPPQEMEPLALARAAQPPAARWREKPDAATAQRLAISLGVAPADVIAFTELSPRFGGRELFGSFSIGWRTAHGGPAAGGWRIVRSPPPPLFTRWHANTLLAMALAIVALSIPAWALARAISRPLARLADAADRAGTGAPLPALPGGSREVRELADAVTTMHARLAEHAASRTAMLGAIAHDLGTPLARLAFWTERLPDGARERAIADIGEMRAMIADTLRFARDEVGAHDAALVDVSSLLDSLAEDMGVGGGNVTLTPGPRAVVRGDPAGLRRLFANLVGNALRYGDAATIGWRVEEGRVAVTVADRGPGIDAAQAERLFEPFVRGDPSRNRATGGTGLGLAIVRSIAGRHGGTATLANRSDDHGAIATVTLPLAR